MPGVDRRRRSEDRRFPFALVHGKDAVAGAVTRTPSYGNVAQIVSAPATQCAVSRPSTRTYRKRTHMRAPIQSAGDALVAICDCAGTDADAPALRETAEA